MVRTISDTLPRAIPPIGGGGSVRLTGGDPSVIFGGADDTQFSINEQPDSFTFESGSDANVFTPRLEFFSADHANASDIAFYKGDGTTVSLLWDQSDDRWEFTDVPLITNLTDAGNADALHVHTGTGLSGVLLADGTVDSTGTQAFVGAAATSDVLTTEVTADGTPRFVIDANGDLWTGTGAAAVLLSMRLSVAGATTLGRDAGAVNTDTTTTAIGFEALKANTTGVQNTAIGYQALLTATTAGQNTAIGQETLKLATGSQNVAIGAFALTASTTAIQNMAIGYLAMFSNTTGSQNAAIGVSALQDNISGTGNTAIGYVALRDNTTAANNTAIGSSALPVNTTGTQNTAIGSNALVANTTANQNIAIGYLALLSNVTGTGNVAIGVSALQNSTVSTLTAIGHQALTTNTTGANLTAIGYQAFTANTTGSWQVAIG